MQSSTNNIFQGNWNELKGKVQKQWGKLSNDDLDVINGNRVELLGKLQKNYGWAQADAEKNLADWERDQSKAA